MKARRPTAPLTDSILHALAALVDDTLSRRDPSHSDIEFVIFHAGLKGGDPVAQGQVLGKAKRVRATLSWSMANDHDAGEVLVAGLVTLIRSNGGFRAGSPNFVGEDPIRNARDAFRSEGYELGMDGDLRPLVLENLEGGELSDALRKYVRRAMRGADDAALLTGTGKDLVEATAAHVLRTVGWVYSDRADFPTLLGQAFTALDLATPAVKPSSGEPRQRRVERALYESGCAVNGLRNKEGTGHGRPWLPSVTDAQAHTAISTMGVVAGLLLSALDVKTGVRPASTPVGSP